MNFRKADISDIPLLLHWDRQPHVIACDPDGDWDWEQELRKNPFWQELFISEYKGEPIGVLQIIDAHHEESHYWGNVSPGTCAIDIWIGEAHNLNKGYGTEMMNWAISRCSSFWKAKEIFIDPLKSNKKAHRFYERIGFIFIEERNFGGDLCCVYHLPLEDPEG